MPNGEVAFGSVEFASRDHVMEISNKLQTLENRYNKMETEINRQLGDLGRKRTLWLAVVGPLILVAAHIATTIVLVLNT